MRKAIISLFTICILLSCGRGYREAMDVAQSQMMSAPDSSLTILQGMDGQALSTRGLRARYALLLTMARDKCYMDVSQDTIIRVAYDWYQHHGSKQERMLSAYYMGVVQQQAGNSIEAILAFREAEPLAKELADYRQQSLTEQHLSAIFARNYDRNQALEYAQRSLKAAELSGDSLMADYCRLDIVNQLLGQFCYADAEEKLEQLLLNSQNNPIMLSFALKKKAHVLIFQKPHNYEGAKSLYEEISSLGVVRLVAEDYGKLALIEQAMGNSSMAQKYLNIEQTLIRERIDSLVFLNDCYNVYDKRGEWRKAMEYLSERDVLQDKVVMDLLRQSETHALEVYYRETLSFVRLRSQYRRYIAVTVGVILFSIIITLILLIKKKNRRLLEDMVKIQEFSDNLDNLKGNDSTTYSILEGLINDKVHSLQQLSESFFSWEDSAIKKREEKKGMMMKDEIISAFRKQLGELRNDHTFIRSLEQSLDVTEKGLMKQVRKVLRQEKELDYTILTLLFSGFSIKSISYLLRMSEAALRMRKTRYKQQFESLSEQEGRFFLEKLGVEN